MAGNVMVVNLLPAVVHSSFENEIAPQLSSLLLCLEWVTCFFPIRKLHVYCHDIGESQIHK